MLPQKTKHLILLSLGHTCVLLGIIGIFLPLLPTTPFVLLATYLYSKSSKKFHSWLLEHKVFGELIRDWEEHGALNLKTKIVSCLSLILLTAYSSIFLDISYILKTISIISSLCILTFILTRPSKI